MTIFVNISKTVILRSYYNKTHNNCLIRIASVLLIDGWYLGSIDEHIRFQTHFHTW